MAVMSCARGCSRLISVSSIPGGNPTALAEPDAWALRYVVCGACQRHVCDRCAAQPPPLAAPGPCPWCGGALAWAGLGEGPPRSVPPTQVMSATPPGQGYPPAMPFSAAGQASAPAPHITPHPAPHTAMHPAPAPAQVVVIPWLPAWRGSGGLRFERSGTREQLVAELPAMEALYRERARIGGVFGWVAFAAFLGALPAAFGVGEMFDDDLALPTIALFGATFVVSLLVWFLVAPAEMSPERWSDLANLLCKLRVAPGSEVRVKLLGPTEGTWLEVSGTLASGTRFTLTREQNKTFVSQQRYGNTIRTTYSITADDTISLGFGAGRYPQAHVEAAAEVLRTKLLQAAGGRLVARGTPTELMLRFPAMVRPTIDPTHRSMPPLVKMLHALLDGAPVVDENAAAPAGASTPANGGILGFLGAPFGIGASAAVLVLAGVGLFVGGAAYAFDDYVDAERSALYEELRALGGEYYTGWRPPETEQRVRDIRAQLDRDGDLDDYAEITALACGAMGCTFSMLGPVMLALSGLGFMRRRQLGMS